MRVDIVIKVVVLVLVWLFVVSLIYTGELFALSFHVYISPNSFHLLGWFAVKSDEEDGAKLVVEERNSLCCFMRKDYFIYTGYNCSDMGKAYIIDY